MPIILGIDPGSQVLGFGALEQGPNDDIEHVKHGAIVAPAKMPFLQRLHWMGTELKKELNRIKPDVVVIEKMFLGKNVQSVFQLGQVRGVVLYQVCELQVPIEEYSVREVRSGVARNGAATKETMNQVLKSLLRLKSLESLDASDALALSYHHAMVSTVEKRIFQMMEKV